jgi:hypothetical protein
MLINSTTTCSPADVITQIITCQTLYASTSTPNFAGSSSVATTNGFTYGEIVNSVFLFMILITGIVISFHIMFRKVKIKN